MASVGAILAQWSRRVGRVLAVETRPDGRDDVRRVNRLIVPVLIGAVFAAVGVGWKADAVAAVLLWVFACFAAGGTLGFLFGIPRSGLPARGDSSDGDAAGMAAGSAAPRSEAGETPRARPNTNLEEVSDWLTKIIVGLTLVNLGELRVEVERICENAAAAIRAEPGPSDISAATALVVGFTLIGFVAVYLYMRLFVQRAIVNSDDELRRYRNALAQAERIAQAEPMPTPAAPGAGPEPVVPTTASLRAAQAVADAAPRDRDLVLQPLRQLAAEYDALRQALDFSGDRTRRMTEVVRRMRPHAIAAAPFVDELMRSSSAGEHLAATVVLQMKYMPEHRDWLVRRLIEERAFIGYQAASVLLARARLAGVAECREIQQRVSDAKAERERLGVAEEALDALIEQILQVR